MSSKRQILVTNALPYANAALHLGHILEYTQTDVWVRFQRMRGHECYYVSADDAHGTAIMLKADEKGISAEQHIADMRAIHEADFKDFLIGVDNYHSTHSEENRELSELIYNRLNDNGHIAKREITQAFDPEKNLFLADRYIKGTCPKCKTDDQYGDNCEACGATYAPTDLINPVSAISGATPIEKESTHYFFKLPEFTEFLQEWTRSRCRANQKWPTNLANGWIAACRNGISAAMRPTLALKSPMHRANIFMYGWMRLLAIWPALKTCCDRDGLDFDQYWAADSDTELYHFIGKDIVNFHALFWPAMLKSRRTTAHPQKSASMVLSRSMAKRCPRSRGTFINARCYLDHLNPEYLRYYYASKLSGSVEDIDLNLEDFRAEGE